MDKLIWMDDYRQTQRGVRLCLENKKKSTLERYFHMSDRNKKKKFRNALIMEWAKFLKAMETGHGFDHDKHLLCQ